MPRIASPDQTFRPASLRSAVLDLLAQAAPKPAALGAPSPEEQEFLDTLRRIVTRSSAEELWEKYHSPRPDARDRIYARYDD